MSDKEINPYDWYRNFFESNLKGRRNFINFFTTDLFKEFNQMQEEMEKIYNQFNDISYDHPKELVREYQTEDGSKVREIGPIVYGYSMTIGPDGYPHIRQFGNSKKIRSSQQNGSRDQLDLGTAPRIKGERESLADVNMTDKEIKVILEMPGVKKEDIRLNLHDKSLEISTSHGQRNYKRTLEIPSDADVDSARSTYNNGILEITFNKIRSMRSKGREIKID